MKVVAIIGELFQTSMSSLLPIIKKQFDASKIRFIEGDNVIDYDEEPFSFSIEPSEYRDIQSDEITDFHMTARYLGNLAVGRKILEDLCEFLAINDIEYTFDYQLEDERGDPISEEYRLSN